MQDTSETCGSETQKECAYRERIMPLPVNAYPVCVQARREPGGGAVRRPQELPGPSARRAKSPSRHAGGGKATWTG